MKCTDSYCTECTNNVITAYAYNNFLPTHRGHGNIVRVVFAIFRTFYSNLENSKLYVKLAA